MSETADGAICSLLVTPRAGRTELKGADGVALRVRVAAPPVNGAANDALIRFLADVVGIPPSRVTVISGAGSRRKRVMFARFSAVELVNRLRGHLGDLAN